VVVTWYVLWHTALGLQLRAVGENPSAAESLGVGVSKLKYFAVIISGGLAGLGGGVLSIEAARVYREGQVAGRGFIGLAALIFGNWLPGGLALGAGFFGFTDALQLRDPGSVHALLLFVAVVLLVLAVIAIRGGHRARTGTLLLVAVGAIIWYATQDTVPDQLVSVLPNVATLVVLGVFAQRLRPPAADGVRWRKGDRT
jgi:simple sugar transport system permease protein